MRNNYIKLFCKFKKQIKYPLIIFGISFFLSCLHPKNTLISYTNPKIDYSGRIDSSKNKGVEMYWSGSSIKLNFKGRKVTATLKDETGKNYYNVILDQKKPAILRIDTIRKNYILADNLSPGAHSIEIFKRTEYNKGKTTFFGFQIYGNAEVLNKPKSNGRKIEFYGNSITSGYAVDDFSGRDLSDSIYTNNYATYAAITARHFKAKYHCISKSGIGVTISWADKIMPDIYDRLNPNNLNKKWNFEFYTPNIVVVNLFQNDSWLVNKPQHREFKKRFGNKVPNDTYFINAYQNFITQLRTHYPNAHIICTLGSMDAAKKDSKWIEYINKAVLKMNDSLIYTHIMPFIEANAHPSRADHKTMAKSLIDFIENTINW